MDDGIGADLALLTAIFGTARDLKGMYCYVEWEPVLDRKILVIRLFSNLFYIIYILKLIKYQSLNEIPAWSAAFSG